MRAASAAVVVFALALFAAASARAAPVGKLTWLGQSCFLFETAAGTRLLMDPAPKAVAAEPPAGLKIDLVTVSHEHPDHNAVAALPGKPRVIRGLTADRKGWTRVDERVRDIAVRSVGVYHDDKRGAERGLDTIFIFEIGGLRIAHLGDLGHPLDEDQLAAIGSVDVLLLPVGGVTTIDARQATRIVDRLRPRLMVVPMHYRTAAAGTRQLDPVDAFIEGKANVQRMAGASVPISPIKPGPAAAVVVLTPQ